MHIFNAQGKNMSMDSLLKGPQGVKIWEKALINEWGRLSQGNVYGVQPSDTITFVNHHEVPKSNAVTYTSFVCDHKPLKSEPWRVRLVVGGDKLDYNPDIGSPASDLTETKILLNSVISDAHKGAKFLSCDIKDFFLATPMETP